MKRTPGENMEHFRHRVLMTRTGTIYRHQVEVGEKLKKPVLYSLADLRARVQEDIGLLCVYCLSTITPRNFSIDHDVPVSREGGSFEIGNLAVTCLTCNQAKGKLTGDEFGELMAMLRRWHPDGKADVLRRLRAGGRALASMFWKSKRATMSAISSEGPGSDVKGWPDVTKE